MDLREQGIFPTISTIKRNLDKKVREQWNLLIGNKGEKGKFSENQGNMLPVPILGGHH